MSPYLVIIWPRRPPWTTSKYIANDQRDPFHLSFKNNNHNGTDNAAGNGLFSSVVTLFDGLD